MLWLAPAGGRCHAAPSLACQSRRCSTAAASELPPEPARAKPINRNVFEVASELPKFGVGAKIFRKNWLKNGYDPNDHNYQITRIEIWDKGVKRPHGKAHGIRTWKGVADPHETKIRSPLKPEWMHLFEPYGALLARPAPDRRALRGPVSPRGDAL